MIGTAYFKEGQLWAEVQYGWPLSSPDWVWWFERSHPAGTRFRYAPTHQFDEMVLKGRLYDKRRARLQQTPRGWPGIESRRYKFGVIPKVNYPRSDDILSMDIGKKSNWDRRELAMERRVVVHCLRDVAALARSDLDLSPQVQANIARFMEQDWNEAYHQVRFGERRENAGVS